MLGASRVSIEQLRAALPQRPDARTLADDLLSVARLLSNETALRGALADPGSDASVRSGIVESMLGGRVGAGAVEVVQEAVSLRWSSARDLADAIAILGADSALIGAESDGRLDAVQDELFRFGRTLAGSGDLQLVLSDPATPADQRTAVVGQLLEGKAQPETVLLVQDAVRNPRGQRLDVAIDALVDQAAVRRERLLAVVRAAIALTDDQSNRLAAALTRIYGQAVQLQIVIDADVLGGVSVTINDEVIDGTTSHRLQQATRLLLGGQG